MRVVDQICFEEAAHSYLGVGVKDHFSPIKWPCPLPRAELSPDAIEGLQAHPGQPTFVSDLAGHISVVD